MAFVEKRPPVEKATCIEAIECMTKNNLALVNKTLLEYVSGQLNAEEPRIKWESARVIGNIAGKFPLLLKKPAHNLLMNATHEGTVVRWATAYALREILKLNTGLNRELLPEIERLSNNEEDTAIKKKYQDALKKVRK